MRRANDHLLMAGILLLVSVYLLLSSELVWHSIIAMGLTFLAAIASFVRYVLERRRT